jgi:hypothetical protein
MATDSNKKLTRYTSAVTVVTAEVMNSLYGGEYAHNLALYAEDEFHPLVSGHVHDGDHSDGHASKVLLTQGAHVRGTLSHANLGGTEGTNTEPAVQKDNIQCYSEAQYGPHGEGLAIPLYEEDPDTGDRCYYLDLSMMIGGEDTHIQYNKDGEFAGDAGLVYDYQNTRVGIGTDDPGAPLHIQSDTNEANIWIYERYDGVHGPDIFLTKSRGDSFAQDGDIAGGIYAGGRVTDGAGGHTNENAAGIRFKIDGVPDPGGNDCPGEIRFLTRPSGGTSLFSSAHNRLVIRSDGNVGIGTLTPTNRFEVVGGDSSFCEGKVMLYGSPQNVSPSGCAVNDMVAFFDGDIDVTGNIDPTGIIFTEVMPDNVPTGESRGALFVSDGTSPLTKNKLYYKDSNGDIIELGSSTPAAGVDGSVQYNRAGEFAGDSSIIVGTNGYLGVGMTPGHQPSRKLHVKDDYGASPVRINDLPMGPGNNVVWDPVTGDLFQRPETAHTVTPKVVTWPEDGSDIVLDYTSRSSYVIVTGPWNGRSRVVIPEIPEFPPDTVDPNDPPINNPPGPDPRPQGEWVTGDNLWIKNMSYYTGDNKMYNRQGGSYAYMTNASTGDVSAGAGTALAYAAASNEANATASNEANATASNEANATASNVSLNSGASATLATASNITPDYRPLAEDGGYQSAQSRGFVPMMIVGSGPLDTIDGEPLSAGYMLAPKDAIQLCCVKGEGLKGLTKTKSTANHWFLVSHYHKHVASYDASPVSVIKVTAINPKDPDVPIDIPNGSTIPGGAIAALTYDGSMSYDPDGDSIAGYQWRITADGSEILVTNKASFEVRLEQFEGQVIEAALSVYAGEAQSSLAYHTVSVETSNSPPVAILTGDSYGIAGEELFLDGRSSSDPDGDIITYSWTVINQPPESSVDLSGWTDSSGSFVPTHSGTYEVSLEVADEYGEKGYASHSCEVAENSVPSVVKYGDNVLMIQTPGQYGYAEDALHGQEYDASIGAYALDTEDGDLSGSIVVSGLDTPIDTSVPGEHTVTYTVTDSFGNTASTTRVIKIIEDSPPVVQLYGPSSISIYEGGPAYTASVDSSYNTDGGDIGAWAIDVEDSVITNLQVEGLPVETGTLGDYSVIYTATDSFGNTGSATRTISIVENNKPVISLIGSEEITLITGQVESYVDEGATASDAENGNLTSSIEVVNPVDIYNPGTYIITYNVTDLGGLAADEVIRTVIVKAPNLPPYINEIIATPSEPVVGDSISFTTIILEPNSGEALKSYEWTLIETPEGAAAILDPVGVNDINSESENVQAILTTDTEGVHTVQLIASDEFDSTAATKSIYVNPANNPPIADFYTDQDSPVTGDTVVLTSTSSDADGTIATYNWEASGPGSFSINPYGETADFTANDAGEYTIKLSVTDDDGESSSISKTLNVVQQNEGPVIGTIAVSGETVIGSAVSLSASVSDSDGTIKSYQWSLSPSDAPDGAVWQLIPDDLVSTDTSPDTVQATFIGSLEGNYTLSLTVIDDLEAESTVTIDVALTKPTNYPDWQDNPSLYEHTATIAAAVVTDDEGGSIADVGDLFAAFDLSGNIRGVASQLVAPLGEYSGQFFYEMTLRSNASGDNLMFKYYDASEDAVLDISETYSFVINDIIGDLNNVAEYTVGTPNTHFIVNVGETGNSQLVIFLDSITYLEPGDEIGIFDSNGALETGSDVPYGEVLVGSAVWDGSQANVVGVVSSDMSNFGGPVLNGAVIGHPVVIKVWRPALQEEFSVTATWGVGSGVYGDALITVTELEASEGNGESSEGNDGESGGGPTIGVIAVYTQPIVGQDIFFFVPVEHEDGAVVSFEWSLGSQPSNSNALLQPAGVQDVEGLPPNIGGQLNVDTAGDYELTFRAINESGQEAKVVEIVTVLPNSDDLDFSGGGGEDFNPLQG